MSSSITSFLRKEKKLVNITLGNTNIPDKDMLVTISHDVSVIALPRGCISVRESVAARVRARVDVVPQIK